MEHEDLTASVWDDVVSPTTQLNYNLNSIPDILHNNFSDLSIEDNIFAKKHSDEEGEEEQEDKNEEGEEYQPLESGNYQNLIEESINEQQHEIRKQEHDKHKHQLISELTYNDQEYDSSLDASFISPTRTLVKHDGSLFNDKDSPIQISKDIKYTSPSKKLNFKNSQLYKTPRPRKYSSKLTAKHLAASNKIHSSDNIDGSILGPLGNDDDDGDDDDNNDNKKSSLKVTPSQDIVNAVDAPLFDVRTSKNSSNSISSSQHQHQQQQPQQQHQQQVQKQPNSLKPKQDVSHLEINVGDPMKIGDITNAHIVYSIKTKNRNQEIYKTIPPTVTVTRRYKDFLWIYHQLISSHPGRIIPPPPTKQTYIGRFNENFIENRRLSLEKMLNRISSNSVLNQDEDFLLFLTSQDFANDSKERERISGSGASLQNSEFLEDGEESIISDAPTTNSNGFMSSLFSMSTKIDDPDEFFIKKTEYIDELEHNLRNFYKSIEIIGQQRVQVIGIYDEICVIVENLANLEISKVTSELLNSFVDVQIKLRDNLERINLQDQLTLGFTIEEYLRIISSIKSIFDYRLKIYQQYHKHKQDLIKKTSQLAKFESKYKQQVEKINLLKFEIEKLQQKTTSFEKSFETITETTKQELENFELERIDDFRNSVEIFIESSIESQKEAIELYETFYERQGLANI
jgi:sorting nexin-1/2